MSDNDAFAEYTKYREQQQQRTADEAVAAEARKQRELVTWQRNNQFLITVLQRERVEQFPMYVYLGYREKKFRKPAGPIFRYVGHAWAISHVPLTDGDDYYKMLTADGKTYSTIFGLMRRVIPEEEKRRHAEGVDHGRGFRVDESEWSLGECTPEQLARVAASAVDLHQEVREWLAIW